MSLKKIAAPGAAL
jgi:hypothetical protein